MNDIIRINLLDWREARRDQRRRNFFGWLFQVALISAAIIAFVTIVIYGQRLETQHNRNDYLEQQINTAEHKVVELKKVKAERASLLRRMRIIEDLQQSRSFIVHFFDQMVATLPEGVYLTSLSQHGETTTLRGIAESNARVSQYMVNLSKSPYLADPGLIVIKSSGGGQERNARFTLRVSHEHPGNDAAHNNKEASS